MSEHDHLDLDALADVLAGEREAPTCETCVSQLDALEAASSAVVSSLSELPAAALPADVASRLDAALAAAPRDASTDGSSVGASVTTLPSLPSREPAGTPRRWLPAAAAAVILVGGVGFAVSNLSTGGGADTASSPEAATAQGGAPLAGLVRNDSGSAYDKDNLATAVPGLLAGKAVQLRSGPDVASAPGLPQASPAPGAATDSSGEKPTSPNAFADSLSRLRSTDGLAGCLAALLPPDDSSVTPLALDYGTFVDGRTTVPALVVVLPVPARADKVDVFVVGAGCAPADEQLLFFARVDRPQG